ncbi:MAG: hypothetical protein AAF624_12775 [Bacteroidota bacterium]
MTRLLSCILAAVFLTSLAARPAFAIHLDSPSARGGPPTSTITEARIVLSDLDARLSPYQATARYDALGEGVAYVVVGTDRYDPLFREAATAAASIRQLRYAVDLFGDQALALSSPGDALFLRDLTDWGIEAAPALVASLGGLLDTAQGVRPSWRDLGRAPAILRGASQTVDNLNTAQREARGLVTALQGLGSSVAASLQATNFQALLSGFTPGDVTGWAARYVTNLETQPLTTSLDAAYDTEVLRADAVTAPSQPLAQQPRTPSGAFLLAPGVYEYDARSYCLRAGTHGESRGRGYLPAALTGARASVIEEVLRGAARHPEVPQQHVQLLLWAIIAQTDFDAMPTRLQQTARMLLAPSDLLALQGGPLSLIGSDRLEAFGAQVNQQLASLSGPMQRAFQAEAGIRDLLAGSQSPGSGFNEVGITEAGFEAFERLAVPAGVAPPDANAPDVDYGAWVWHPGGYYLSYRPRGYSRTNVRIYVPGGASANGVGGGASRGPSAIEPFPVTQTIYDPASTVAVPANRNAQRLGTQPPSPGEEPPAPISEPIAQVADDRCEDGGGGMQVDYDRTNRSTYHRYPTPGTTIRTRMCEAGSPNCNRSSVYQVMLSNTHHIAPPEDPDTEGVPVTDCMVVDVELTIPRTSIPAGILTGFIDQVTTVVDTTNYAIRNYTRENHALHPGVVQRRVVEDRTGVWIETNGEGNGIAPRTNEDLAPSVWAGVDAVLQRGFDTFDFDAR